MAQTQHSHFLRLPSEVIERVLTDPSLPPESVAAVAACCRGLHALVNLTTDSHLWRSLYLNHFDDPRELPEAAWNDLTPAWKQEYQKRCRAVGIVRSGGLKAAGKWDRTYWSNKPRQRLDAVWRSRLEAIEVICGIAATAAPTDTLSTPSRNVSLLESQVLPSSVSFEAPDGVYSSPSRSESNLVRVRAAIDAKLLVYLGCELRPKRDKMAFLRWQKTVFHLSTYRGLPEFSPFTADEEVVWALVGALMMIMVTWSWEWQSYDPEDASEIAEVHRGIRVGPEAVRRGTQHGWHERSERDWAGLEGLWTGTYTFVDHSDFIAFNQPGTVIEDDLRSAAGGKILMRLHICPLALANSSLPRLNPADYPPSRPPLAFSGSSLSQGFQVGVYGQVTYEKDGHLHWRFVVYYGGADRWRLEGVQVHEGARMGIIGVWSPAEGDPRGPVGPFWYWKADEDTGEDEDSEIAEL